MTRPVKKMDAMAHGHWGDTLTQQAVCRVGGKRGEQITLLL